MACQLVAEIQTSHVFKSQVVLSSRNLYNSAGAEAAQEDRMLEPQRAGQKLGAFTVVQTPLPPCPNQRWTRNLMSNGIKFLPALRAKGGLEIVSIKMPAQTFSPGLRSAPM